MLSGCSPDGIFDLSGTDILRYQKRKVLCHGRELCYRYILSVISRIGIDFLQIQHGNVGSLFQFKVLQNIRMNLSHRSDTVSVIEDIGLPSRMIIRLLAVCLIAKRTL